MSAQDPRVSVMPTLRCRDAAAMVEWLVRVFGFEERLVVPGEDGTVVHAQLTFGNGLVMLGQAAESEWDELVRPGAGGQSVYVLVPDVDAHCAHARAAGAEVVVEPADQEYGGRFWAGRDPEGQVWGFGSYDPFAEGRPAEPGS